MSDLTDKYRMYLCAVQSPQVEVNFLVRAFKDAHGFQPTRLREDFCGTAAVCCAWVTKKSDRYAVGVDDDEQSLTWGLENNLSDLSETERGRITLLQDDVRMIHRVKAHVVAAQNFSFYVFTTRDDLFRYFRAAYRNLGKEGVLVLDMLGGYSVMKEGYKTIRRCPGFRYIWENLRFDPITHLCRFAIHFEFPNGRAWKRAFVYDFRFWTVPEVRELLTEAGFAHSHVYWEGTDSRTGFGNDVYRRREHAESDPVWVAYVVGVK